MGVVRTMSLLSPMFSFAPFAESIASAATLRILPEPAARVIVATRLIETLLAVRVPPDQFEAPLPVAVPGPMARVAALRVPPLKLYAPAVAFAAPIASRPEMIIVFAD